MTKDIVFQKYYWGLYSVFYKVLIDVHETYESAVAYRNEKYANSGEVRIIRLSIEEK